MIYLGGRSLDSDLRLTLPHNVGGVSQSVSHVLGGVRVQSLAVSVGRQVVLAAVLDGSGLYGRFSLEDAQAIAGFRDAGHSVDLVHPVWSGPVVVLADGVSIEPVPVDGCVNPGADVWFHGTVSMVTV